MSYRFRRAYRNASVPLQRLAEGAVHDLVNKLRDCPSTAAYGYDRLAHLQPKLGLLEVDVSGANRMVVELKDGQVHLLDLGGHETVPRYTFGKYQTDKHQKEPATSVFWPETNAKELRFFTQNPCELQAQFGTEQSSEWLYFLSQQQSLTLNEIMETIISSDDQHSRPVFLVGGLVLVRRACCSIY